MEATGQYWKPIWHVLEDRPGWDLQLVNARHVEILPGRKTDVADGRFRRRRRSSASRAA
jgi:hypothetical protein